MKKYLSLHLLFLLLLTLLPLTLSGCKASGNGNPAPIDASTASEDASDESVSAPASGTNSSSQEVPASYTTPRISSTPGISPTPTVSITPGASSTPLPSATKIPASTPTDTASDKISQLLKNMTLEEKVGQLFFVRCRKDSALADIDKYYLGGYILFGDDFKDQTKDSMKKLLSNYQKESKIPLLIGVDEEGGTVNRISKYTAFRSSPFKSPQDLYKEGGFDLIISDTIEKAALLKGLGINVNLAPVCDVSTSSDDFIYKRSFGKDAKETAEYVKTVVLKMKEQEIGSTLKHFPGYGNNVDTHTGISIDKRSYSQFEDSDFLPFVAGINAGADSILVSHNIVTSMDEDYPASLSDKVHRILREDLNFTGVIMTDDLSMDAIKDYTGDEEAAILAITAGNDFVIASDFDVQIPAVIQAVKDGKISKERIDESVTRILNWKLSLGLLD